MKFRSWLAAIGLGAYPFCGVADVVMDGSLGPGGALVGPNFAITEALGQRSGDNLFHSFERFGLNAGEIATFSGNPVIRNIVARVTGGQASTIDGTLRSTIAGADLYLLNPAGVVFGANASLDLGGSLYTATADYLKLGAGGVFDTDLARGTVLSAAAPSAFGFRDAGAAIQIQNAGLEVPTGETLALIGGAITVTGPGAGAPVDNLVAPQGRVELVATASAGELAIAGGAPDVSGFAQLADILFEEASYATANGDGGGDIYLRGNDVTLTGSAFIESNSDAGLDGGVLDVQARATLLIDDFSTLSSYTATAGDAASLVLSGRDVTIRNGSYVFSLSDGAGAAGDLTLSAENAVEIADRQFGLNTQVFSLARAAGAGGDVTVVADRVEVRDAFLRAGQAGAGSGAAGTLQITTGTLAVRDGAVIDVSTRGSGAGGSMVIDASRSVTVAGRDQDGDLAALSSSSGPVATGAAGSILVTTPTLTVSDATIQAATTDAAGGDVVLRVDTFSLVQGGRVLTSSFGAGQGGNVNVALAQSGAFSGSNVDGTASGLYSQALGSGAGGNIEVRGPGGLSLASGGRLDVSATGTGDAGSIDVALANLTARNAQISAAATQSSGGNVDLAVSDLRLYASPVSATVTGGSGDGGNVTITATSLVALDDSDITARADQGHGGDIRITADVFLRSDDVDLDASSNVLGNEGRVEINAPEQNLAGELAEYTPVPVTHTRPTVGCRSGVLAVGDAAPDPGAPLDPRGPWMPPPERGGTSTPGYLEAMQAYREGRDRDADAMFRRLAARDTDPGERALALANALRAARDVDGDAARAGDRDSAPAKRLAELRDALPEAGWATPMAVSAMLDALATRGEPWPVETLFKALLASRAAIPAGTREDALLKAVMARLYAAEGRNAEARRLYHAALAQAPAAWQAAWLREVGDLSADAGDLGAAQDAWRAASDAYWQERAMLAGALRQRGGSFRGLVGPMLERLVETSLGDAPTSPAALQALQQDWERLKVAEVAEYNGDCLLAEAMPLAQVQARDTGSAVLYPMVLADRLEILVRRGDALERCSVRVGRDRLAADVTALRRAIERHDDETEIKAIAQRLYGWLIAPLEHALAGADTLVMVPDGPLRGLPLGVLYDGQRYLVERVASTAIPGLTLVSGHDTARGAEHLLLAGLGIGRDVDRQAAAGRERETRDAARTGTPASLANAGRELNALERLFGSDRVTLMSGADYRLSRLRERVAAQRYQVLHIASHAYFDAARGSGLLVTTAADEVIDARTLGELVAMAADGQGSLELLTLSACDTAIGDERAALGLAGIAARIGARSALATLWEVGDATSLVFMTEFYRRWHDATATPRAVLLQATARAMLADPRLAHPYNWAGFLLVGDWRA